MFKKLFIGGIVIFSLAYGISFIPPQWHRFAFVPRIEPAYAAVSITTATGGSSISADTTSGTYTMLTGPTIQEGASRDIPGTGTIVLSAPSGFIFNTGAIVTATITRDTGNKNCFTFASNTATPTTSTITFSTSTSDSNTNTYCHVTFSNVQVRPSSGTPLASGNITYTGSAVVSGLATGTNLGTLTEVIGANNKLAITTQPPATAAMSTNFSTNPVVALQDQFGNTETADSTTTITESVVLSTQSCGGTAGSGTLTSSPTSGSAVTNGVMTYTAMQYSAAENIKICFSSAGLTSALSNAINVGIVSVTISSNGVVSYGTVPLNTSKDTTATGLNSSPVVQNNGTVAEDFTIKGQNSANWTLAATNGANQYTHKYSTNGGGLWTALSTSFQALFINVAVGASQSFDLQLTTPTSTASYSQQSVDITIGAVAY